MVVLLLCIQLTSVNFVNNQSWLFSGVLFGAFLQALLLLRHRLSLKSVILMFFILFVGSLLLGWSDFAYIYGASLFYIIFCSYFIVSYSLLYKYRVLSVISRRSLVGLTVIFWYLFITSGRMFDQLGSAVINISLIFSVIVFIVTLHDWPIHKVWKMLCYIWFLILTVYFTIYNLSMTQLGAFIHPATAEPLGFVGAILLGMVLFYVLLHGLFLLQALPYQLLDKRKSLPYALWEWRLHTELLANRYWHDKPLFPLDTLIVAVCFFLVLLANELLHLIPEVSLVDALILYTTIIFERQEKKFSNKMV
jgi:hypothetical protein